MPPKYKYDMCGNRVRDDRFCHANPVTNRRYQLPSEEFLKRTKRNRRGK